MGHARSLLSLEDEAKMQEVFERIVEENLSVRQVEDIVRSNTSSKEAEPKKVTEKSNLYSDLEKNISDKIGMKVVVKSGSKGGTMTIHFKNKDELTKIEELFS